MSLPGCDLPVATQAHDLSINVLHSDERIPGAPRYWFGPPGEKQMYVPDIIRKCVCFLAYKTNPNAEPKLAGTAFFVGVPVSNMAACYAVTARHCVEMIRKESADMKVYLRLNMVDGPARFVESRVDQWVFHPTNDHIDVAVLPIAIEDHVDHRMYPISGFATNDRIRQEAIGLGDEVFLAGLFREHTGRQRNIPLVRVGNIAATPEEPIEVRGWGSMEAYLIEARSIGGLSGSPVFVHLEPISRMKAGQLLIGTGEADSGRASSFLLLGLMHGHWDLPNADTAVQDASSGQSVNMGIAIVVPAQMIADVINRPEFYAQRVALEEQIRQSQNFPVED